MPHSRRRLHLRLRHRLSRPPRAHPGERVDLDRVVVAGCGHLSRGVERRMTDAQPALVLAHQRRRAALALAANLPQIPHPHEAVQGCRGEEVRLRRVQREAADFLLAELPCFGGVWGAGVGAADVAVEAREVQGVGGGGVDFDAGEGFVVVRGGGGVDFGAGGGGEVEEAETGVVGGGVEVGGVERGELESADCAGVQVERGDVGFGGVVIFVAVGFGLRLSLDLFGLDGRIGLGGIEDAEVAELVAGENEGFVDVRVEAE